MEADFNVLLLKVLAVVALVLLNAFFVAAEFALVKVRLTQLEPLIAAGHRRAALARRLIQHLDASIGATQLGITLVGLGMGVLVEPVFQALMAPLFDWTGLESEKARHTIALGSGFFVNTFLLVVLGELGPKALAIRKTLPTMLWTAAPLVWFYRLSFPFIWLLNISAQWLLRQVGIQPADEADLAHSEEELRLMFAASQKRAGATTLGHDIVLNALDLRHRIVREVMRPRQEIVALDTRKELRECIELAERTRFSRFPLCEAGDIDRTVGVVHLKELYAMRLKARTGGDLRPAARKLIYVPETARLEKLLQVLLDRKLHMALVVDEYGGTVGLVTLENILEELVGQIQDEFDQEKPLVVRLSDDTWEVLGALPLHDLEALAGVSLAGDGAATVSGWVTQRLGGFPKSGDVVQLGRFELRVEEMDDTRVERLRLLRLADSAGSPR